MSIIDTLKSFDMVRGVAADYMHCVCLGVTRQFTTSWLETKSHSEVYYLGQKTNLVDKRLKEIRPPSEIHRAPHSITDRQHWKGSTGLYGIYTILSDSITTEDIRCANSSLVECVIKAEELYGHLIFTV